MAEEILNQNSQAQVKSIVERVERLEAEKAEIAAQIKEVLAEAKANGFCPKTIRKAVKVRKTTPAARAEEAAMLDIYLGACGDLPLFEGSRSESRGDDAVASISITTMDGRTIGASPDVVRAALSTLATDDELYTQAVEFVRHDNNPSVSYVQRRLQIGYNKAAGFIERMEREGIVGPANHVGKRELLVAA